MSKCWFVSRHAGAREWLERQGWTVDRQVAHLDPEQVGAGDVVYGTLPVHLAAELCARGAQYHHLILDLPAEARGCELSADELERFGARLVRFHCEAVRSGDAG
ncbi:CRISPR-associated protein Csx16 [Pseudomonas sp. AN-1]|uniref:CRISPR-associated protein Csx16 n=1 Tax=Pseudomonas sp. AN-1 TaxID=3096605 RepID=UPI002A6A6331|nr:CRISPR-associated protein Csx16 [Pseudomonas sp. AN-1]WPP46915.1 CRISPR-associated protein Csx16 [Pseudomonas sp. AN-1]